MMDDCHKCPLTDIPPTIVLRKMTKMKRPRKTGSWEWYAGVYEMIMKSVHAGLVGLGVGVAGRGVSGECYAAPGAGKGNCNYSQAG